MIGLQKENLPPGCTRTTTDAHQKKSMKTVAYLAVSLDGYIADRNGGVDWLNEIPNPDQSDFGFAEFMKSIDAVVMGANTFRVVQSFGVWPYEKAGVCRE